MSLNTNKRSVKGIVIQEALGKNIIEEKYIHFDDIKNIINKKYYVNDNDFFLISQTICLKNEEIITITDRFAKRIVAKKEITKMNYDNKSKFYQFNIYYNNDIFIYPSPSKDIVISKSVLNF